MLRWLIWKDIWMKGMITIRSSELHWFIISLKQSIRSLTETDGLDGWWYCFTLWNRDIFQNQSYIYLIFWKKNQIEYYDRISEVRRSGNYEQWVGFFLEAVSAAAKDSLATVEKLSTLHENNVCRLPITTRKNDNVRRVFDYIEQYPIIEIKRTAADLGVSYNTVSSAVDKLVQTGILKETTNASRNRVFSYEEYLNILRKDTW